MKKKEKLKAINLGGQQSPESVYFGGNAEIIDLKRQLLGPTNPSNAFVCGATHCCTTVCVYNANTNKYDCDVHCWEKNNAKHYQYFSKIHI